jgi:hypothetical protein
LPFECNLQRYNAARATAKKQAAKKFFEGL